MKHIKIETIWTTEAGLLAVVIMYGDHNSHHHRCGYVQVTEDSPLFGKHYSEQLSFITREQADNTQVGKKGPIITLTARCRSDGEDLVRRSLDIIIDVHGGLTYSGDLGCLNGKVSKGWWFGFATANLGDNLQEGGRPLEYCIAECESLAKQLKEVETNASQVQTGSNS